MPFPVFFDYFLQLFNRLMCSCYFSFKSFNSFQKLSVYFSGYGTYPWIDFWILQFLVFLLSVFQLTLTHLKWLDKTSWLRGFFLCNDFIGSFRGHSFGAFSMSLMVMISSLSLQFPQTSRFWLYDILSLQSFVNFSYLSLSPGHFGLHFERAR